MTQVGHTLTGAVIGITCLPRNASSIRKITHLVSFMALSLVPDFKLTNWGHDKYYISHSIFINLLLITAMILLLAVLKEVRIKLGGWNVIAGGAAAWLSHLLLDSLYNHGKGLAIFWPFSKARLVLSIPWLSVVTQLPPPITPELIRILVIEFATFFPLVLLALFMRRRFTWN